MKKLIPLFIFISISCDKELPGVMPPFQSEIVINSIIRPDTLVIVMLSNTVSILTPTYPDFLEGATIRLFENEVFLGLLNEVVLYPEDEEVFHVPNGPPLDKLVGIYTLDYIPKENMTYRLEVDHPDYPSASVSTHIPETTSSFEAILSEPVIEWYDYNEDGEKIPGGISYTPTIKIKDASISNYYEVAVIGEFHERIYEYDENDEVLSSRDVTYLQEVYFSSEDILFNEVSKPEILDGRNPFDGDDGKVFSDLLFNNEEYSFKINFFVPIGRKHDYLTDEVVFEYKRFFIEVRSVSEEYYKYKHTLEIQRSNYEDPFADPVQVYTNVENGLGIFAGYNVELFEFSLEEFIPE